MDFHWLTIKQYWPALAHGALTTFAACAASLVLGSLLGILLCWGKLQGRGPLYRLSMIVIEVFRTIPELVPIFWIYTCLPLLFSVKLSPLASGIVALTFYAGAFLAEIFRGGILAIPRGQYEAAAALSIPAWQKWTVVIGPQAAKIMLPAFLNFVCDLVKVSSLLSAIGIAELSYAATIASGDSYRYLEIYTLAGALYLAILLPVTAYGRYRERRMNGTSTRSQA